uniref:Putative ovule protein n=1 Tax=Solanum chacoense TaxID=4108 RepID=A0A0V0GPY9_SOLCH
MTWASAKIHTSRTAAARWAFGLFLPLKPCVYVQCTPQYTKSITGCKSVRFHVFCCIQPVYSPFLSSTYVIQIPRSVQQLSFLFQGSELELELLETIPPSQ